MSDCSDESDDCDDEEEDSAGDDAAHDGERRDDRHRLPVRCSPDQDKRHQLQRKQENFKFVFYRPKHSCGKVMFLPLLVILFIGGVWQTHLPPGRHPPRQTHPSHGGHFQDTATAEDGTHPTGMHFWFFWRTCVFFVRSLIPLFWTFGDVSSGFQSQGGSLRMHASLPVCN